MTGARLMVEAASVLRLAPHIVFRFDETRQRWIMMAPERLMLPDEQAVEILKLVDGTADVATIVGTLAARYNAAHAEIAGDVTEMLQDLADKGCLADANAG
jgi:pyrroloquinoline quinone biosynthesis protein D